MHHWAPTSSFGFSLWAPWFPSCILIAAPLPISLPALSMSSPSKVLSQFLASGHPSTAYIYPLPQHQHFHFCKSGSPAPTLSRTQGQHFRLCACHLPEGKVHHRSNTSERWTKGRTEITLWDLGDHWWCAGEHFCKALREAILGSYALSTQPKNTCLTSNLSIFWRYPFYPNFIFLLLIISESQSLSHFPSYLYYYRYLCFIHLQRLKFHPLCYCLRSFWITGFSGSYWTTAPSYTLVYSPFLVTWT